MFSKKGNILLSYYGVAFKMFYKSVSVRERAVLDDTIESPASAN